MRITEAAKELGVSPRMLRYRESLGLLPTKRAGGTHRQYDEADLRMVRRCLELERRYGITPAALAFGIRALADPSTAAQLQHLADQLGHAQPQAVRALDFEKRRAQQWLSPRAGATSADSPPGPA